MTIFPFPFLIPLAVFSFAFVAQYGADVAALCSEDPKRDTVANGLLAFAIIGRWGALALTIVEIIFRVVY